MVRIHLAQILYNQAYFDAPMDFLEEPTFISEKYTPLGKLRSLKEISDFLAMSKSSYLKHIEMKIINIVDWSYNRKANILAFPEYSIPYQILPKLHSLSQKYLMCIIAGTHRIPQSDDYRDIYKTLRLAITTEIVGCACTPIFLPDGSITTVFKKNKSKWEPRLREYNQEPQIINVIVNNSTVRLAVIPCVDSLHMNIIGRFWSDQRVSPNVIICPSLTPSTDEFLRIGPIALLKNAFYAFINTASIGGTFYYLPPSWTPFLYGPRSSIDPLSNNEAILEIDLDPEKFYSKRESIDPAPILSYPIAFPIVYQKRSPWLTEYLQLKDDINKNILTLPIVFLQEVIDSYLAEMGNVSPFQVLKNLKYLKHWLPFYDGNIHNINNMLELVQISQQVEDTQIFWSKRISGAINLLLEFLKKPFCDFTNDAIDCLRNLKEKEKSLPKVTCEKPFESSIYIPPKKEFLSFSGEEDLLESFQNRGTQAESIKTVLSNDDNKLLIITGPIGIGKSDFVNWLFRKVLTDWSVIKVIVPNEVRFSRILSEIAYKIGLQLDADVFETSSKKIYMELIDNIVNKIYSVKRRALVIDDMEQILKDRNPQDYRQFGSFLQKVASPLKFIGGRIFILSGILLPDTFINLKGIFSIKLKELPNMYIKRIVEYHIRKASIYEGEKIPTITQDLLDIIKGNPLSARLVVDALRGKKIKDLREDLDNVTGHIANEILKRVKIDDDDRDLMRRLSVFRLPVNLYYLKQTKEFRNKENKLKNLAKLCILNYDGNCLEIHEAVRRHYYHQIVRKDLLNKYHRIAAEYYQLIYDNQKSSEPSNPSINSELVYHLAKAGEISRAKELGFSFVKELKQAAKIIYRDKRDWEKALSLYRIIVEVTPDDTEALAYLGRCYGRMDQWEDSDSTFTKAIDVAKKMNKPIWCILRDWGHIRARFGFFSHAQKYYTEAESLKPDDPSIKAAIAYLRWKQGDKEAAFGIFQDILNNYPDHRYTLTYFPRLLESMGNNIYAEELLERLDELGKRRPCTIPCDDDIEIDDDIF